MGTRVSTRVERAEWGLIVGIRVGTDDSSGEYYEILCIKRVGLRVYGVQVGTRVRLRVGTTRVGD